MLVPRIDRKPKTAAKSMPLAHPESRQSRVATPKKPLTIKKKFSSPNSFFYFDSYSTMILPNWLIYIFYESNRRILWES